MVMAWHPAINEWLIDLFEKYNVVQPPHADHSFTSWLVLAITTPLILFVAWPIHRAAIRNIFHPTMDTLVSLGALSAYFWSIYATYTNSGEPYTEVAAGVLFFVILGRYLEARAKRSASSALSALLALGEREVAVMRSGVEVIIPISQLILGDEFVVKPGARIATDGVVISGQSSVNNSMITGESAPVDVAPGSKVVGSAMNNNGRIIVRATRIGSDTELARITSMVVTAQGRKTPIQAKADKIAAFFVPAVTVLAAVTFEGWYLFGGKSLSDSISIAITVLVIACPCALGLATPVALLVASGRGALRGIVLRNPRVLEASKTIDVVVLDKTGTLTEGDMSVRDFTLSSSASKVLGAEFKELLTEKNILSTAAYALARGAAQLPVDQLSQTPGVGVAARVNIGGKSPVVLIGAPISIAHSCIPFDGEISAAIRKAEDNSYAVSVLAWDGVALAVFASGDVLKSDAVQTLAELHKRGITTWLVSGDNDQSAASIGHKVGIAATHIIADLSIAMGTGTDAAMSSADITLMRPQLAAVTEALDLSKKTLSTIKGNLTWAFLYNVIGLPLAVLGLATPMYAAGAMAVSSLFVVSNSLRLAKD
jgi:Cu+-exporting ATPase